MPYVCLVYGAALVALGLWGYFGVPGFHPTALIPAGFGAVFIVLGALGVNPKFLKHAMHAAAALALLLFVATVRGVFGALYWLTGGEIERPMAAVSQSITAVLSLLFVGLAVNSFIQVRKARKREAQAAAREV